MARTLFPHHRHINFDPGLYRALAQVALWRRCSQAAYVRDAVEVIARGEYATRGVAFPPDFVEVVPGQASMFPPAVSPGDPLVIEGCEVPGHRPPTQAITDPEGKAAVRSFLSLGRGIAVDGPVGPTVEPTVEAQDV